SLLSRGRSKGWGVYGQVGRGTLLLQDDQLAVHMGRMQLTLDVKYTNLVSSKFDRLRLTAVHHLLDFEVWNGKTVILPLRLDVIDHLDLHRVALMDHQRRRNKYLSTFVLDIDHRKLIRTASARG